MDNTPEQPKFTVDFTVYQGAGNYSIRHQKGCTINTQKKFVNNIEELRKIISAHEAAYKTIIKVTFRGA